MILPPISVYKIRAHKELDLHGFFEGRVQLFSRRSIQRTNNTATIPKKSKRNQGVSRRLKKGRHKARDLVAAEAVEAVVAASTVPFEE